MEMNDDNRELEGVFGGGDVSLEEDDPCLLFVSNIVLRTMRAKYEKWVKLMATEEYKRIVVEWRRNENESLLIFTQTSNGALSAALNYPFPFRGKSCYFIKRCRASLDDFIDDADGCNDDDDDSSEDVEGECVSFQSMLLYGDLSSQTLDNFSIIVEQIFAPLLSNPSNQCRWPIELKHDVTEKFNDLLESVAVVKGNLSNKTFLPLPLNIDRALEFGEQIIDGTMVCDLKTQNILEGIAIKWSYLINDVVIDTSAKFFNASDGQSSSSSALPAPPPPTPSTEITFWNERYANLDNLYGQLTEKRRKMVGQMLEKISSVYYTAFRQAFQHTITSLVQARDVCIHLNALNGQLHVFQNTIFHECAPLIRPLLHCICLMWRESKHYPSANWPLLFKMIANMLIEESTKNLDPDTLFQNDVEDTMMKIDETVVILKHFKHEVAEHKSHLQEYKRTPDQPVLPWSFQLRTVFERLNAYERRLCDMQEIFHAANDFFKLEKIEIGGCRGRCLNQKLHDVSSQFQTLYNGCVAIDYNPLDPSNERFNGLRQTFQRDMMILERKLAQILCEAFDDCYSIEASIKLIEMVGALAQRQPIAAQISIHFERIVEQFNADIDAVELIFDQHLATLAANGSIELLLKRDHPPIAGTLSCFRMLRLRLERVSEPISFMEFSVFDTEKGQSVMQRQVQLVERIKQIEQSIFDKWAHAIPADIHLHTAQHLLKRSDEGQLCVNFNEKLILTLKECAWLMNMDYGYVLPGCALNFYKTNDTLWEIRVLLSRIVEQYNFIHGKTEKCEFDIVFDQVRAIDADAAILVDEFTWQNFDHESIKQIHEKVTYLYGRIVKVHENVENVLESIMIWGNVPLYQRKDINSSDSLLDIDDRPAKCKSRSYEVGTSRKLIEYTMEENFRLLFDLPQLVRQKECGKNRLKKTIIRQFGRHQATEKIRRLSSMIEVPDMTTKISTAVEHFQVVEIAKTEQQRQLFRPYQEHVDRLVCDALKNAIDTSS